MASFELRRPVVSEVGESGLWVIEPYFDGFVPVSSLTKLTAL